MVNNHGDRKSPIPGVISLPNGRVMAYKCGLSILYTDYLQGGPNTSYFHAVITSMAVGFFHPSYPFMFGHFFGCL